MMLARLRRVCCYHVYVPFSNVDPALRTAEVLKRSGAVPAEMIAGRRRIKPSRKAKRAASINSSDEELNGDPQDEPVNTGAKRKASKKASSATNKQKPNEAPKAKQAHKRAHVDSEDAESSDEDPGHAQDQADAYEWLRLECETDRPVCGEIKTMNYLLLTNPFRSKKCAVPAATTHVPLTSALSSPPMSVQCRITPLRKAIGVKFASKSISHAYHFLAHHDDVGFAKSQKPG
jgi:hypothetical protein